MNLNEILQCDSELHNKHLLHVFEQNCVLSNYSSLIIHDSILGGFFMFSLVFIEFPLFLLNYPNLHNFDNDNKPRRTNNCMQQY